MITMMMLLCYVNMSGMSLECIVIVLMNKSLLGGQFCTDYVDVHQNGNNQLGRRDGRLAIIPRLNFTCDGRITGIRARVAFDDNRNRNEYPFFQVWRPTGSRNYNRISEVQLQSNQVTGRGTYRTANIILTENNTIEFQSGDVVGYYHPPQSRYQVRTIQTNGYVLYRFDGSPAPTSVDLSNANHNDNRRQPLIQFTVGKCTFSHLLKPKTVTSVG